MQLGKCRTVLWVCCAGLVCLSGIGQRRRRANSGNEFGFRFLGPQVGNRVASVAGVPGDPSTYYAGAASGGVWKSSDGGNSWHPVFDKEPVAAIGALAVAPSDPNVVWAGTGEAWAIRDIDVTGDGVYKSDDKGKTWTNMGLDQTGRIGRIVIDPKDSNTVFVCALGRLSGPQQERGVYKTTDGGKTWKRVLFADERTGCSGLAMDPQNSRVMFAGMWQVKMRTWGEFSGGPGSGVFVSRDSGNTWSRITGHGLPNSPVGKIDVAVAPTDSNRVYALIETYEQGSLWRSDDGGQNWRVVNWNRALIGRAGYYIRLAVSPGNENEVLVANSGFWVSLDGGETIHERPWGGDNHDIWMDPRNPDRFAITFDGGLAITTVHGRGFHNVRLPIGQMYHVAVDNQIPYDIYTNMQDDGTMRGPSVPRPERGGGDGWEHGLGGCESGFTLPDPTDPNIVWASCYGDEVTRWDAKTKQARSVSPWLHTLDAAPNQIKYRCHWTPPLAIDPFDHDTVYYGCQVVFKTTNSGQSWIVDSPDLSTKDPSRIVSSGGLIGDNLGQFYGEVVFALAPSPIQKGLLWAGTNDGKVWYTREGGGHWVDVTQNIGMPAWGTVTSIEPSFFNAGTAYISVDFHLVDNRDPYIYKTENYGKTWKKISDGLPKGPLAYVRNVSEDPNCKGLLFAGTGHALYYSLNDGSTWTQLKTGLPPSPVTWTVVQKQFHDLVVSTYGRGIYVLDDITPLEQMAKSNSAGDVTFFTPRPTYRLLHNEYLFFNFSLKSAAKEPVKIEILDDKGAAIRKLQGTGHAGINRIAWDMHATGPRMIELRTTPPENPHIWEEPQFRGAAFRPITHWGMSTKQTGPMVPPGTYKARLTVDGKTYDQTVKIVMDPHSSGSAADIEATVQLQREILADVSNVSDMVNTIEWMRKQLNVVEKMLSQQKERAELLTSVQNADKKMQAVEYELVSEPLTASDDKYYVSAYKIYYKLLWLNAEVGSGAGDVAGGGDYGPTDTSRELFAGIQKQLAAAKVDYNKLMQVELPALNQTLINHSLLPIVASTPKDMDGGIHSKS